jgi:cytoskeletal protein CcmA (bactofilin family)
VAERIVVHQGGVVNARIKGNPVVIAGTVEGDLRVRNEFRNPSQRRVLGSVTTAAINARPGGRVEGCCAIENRANGLNNSSPRNGFCPT